MEPGCPRAWGRDRNRGPVAAPCSPARPLCHADREPGHRLLRLSRPQPADHRRNRLAGRGDHRGAALRPGTSCGVAFDQLAGALYYRLRVTGEPIGAAYAEELVDQVLTGIGATACPERSQS